MRRTTGALVSASVLLGVLAGCGSDTPSGTLTKDQVKGATSVKTRTGIANQVVCQDIDDAEDRLVDVQPYEKGKKMPSVVFDLTGDSKDHEFVDNSVWPVTDPERSVQRISEGIDACVEGQPENYERIDSIKGYPKAVGYVQKGNNDVFTRRLFVPLEDRVVVVGVLREGSDDYTVAPEDLLPDAVKAAPDAKVE